ncbi:hypothetical protein EV702DRAFT_1091787 [Suillus placidus]|uniref:Uncharacterized protein n=1 Tax=Suillus placidus TaxID=48579 RepID=A0A9P6ZXW9_9AGAM|nr:hypothetical protein EV702DRAFT_1091787 [Suillus placidus]
MDLFCFSLSTSLLLPCSRLHLHSQFIRIACIGTVHRNDYPPHSRAAAHLQRSQQRRTPCATRWPTNSWSPCFLGQHLRLVNTAPPESKVRMVEHHHCHRHGIDGHPTITNVRYKQLTWLVDARMVGTLSTVPGEPLATGHRPPATGSPRWFINTFSHS